MKLKIGLLLLVLSCIASSELEKLKPSNESIESIQNLIVERSAEKFQVSISISDENGTGLESEITANLRERFKDVALVEREKSDFALLAVAITVGNLICVSYENRKFMKGSDVINIAHNGGIVPDLLTSFRRVDEIDEELKKWNYVKDSTLHIVTDNRSDLERVARLIVNNLNTEILEVERKAKEASIEGLRKYLKESQSELDESKRQ